LKKVLSAIIIIFMLAFMQAYAANDSRLSYDTAKEVMLKNSRPWQSRSCRKGKPFISTTVWCSVPGELRRR